MDSITRQFGLLCLGVLAVALAACASNDVSQCAASGILCPAGMHCAAVQAICIADSNLCGNGDPTDPEEECDDGNTIDGDGCSHECKKETCGNGRRDFGEVCDLGPGMNGKCMGCAADCKSFETCGDGVLDTACQEVCDDHNTKDGDGCAHDCKSTEVCGNGIIDREVGEVCDDGKDKNGTPGDACDVTCRSNRSCGNATVDKDQGEECDAGKFGPGNLTGNDDSNDCRKNCQFNRCGDGLVDNQDGPRHEQCDGGSLQPDSHNQPVATPAETPDCNIDCTTPSCGDGKVNRHFTPKDALGNPAAGPEQCDDGAANSDNAACTALCQVNVCGDHHKLIGVEACDDGGVDTSNCNANCTAPTCGDGHVNLLFMPDGIHAEQCDNGKVAGVNQNQDNAACTSTCQINVCGDGKKLEGVEQCDSGGIDTDQCDKDCTKPVCGDGHINTAAGEACDDGADNGTSRSKSGCNQFCQFNGCGNGVLEGSEQCDNGTTVDSATCNGNCTLAKCGDGHTNTAAGEACDEGAANGTLPGPTHCNQFCHFNSCGNGILEPGEACDDGTVNGVNQNHAGARCNAACQFNVCGDNDKLVGVEECDEGGVDTLTCDSDCTKPVCGDKHVNMAFGEQCDDGVDNGKTSSVNHCDAFCKTNLCGNGIVDVSAGEECDPGGGPTPVDIATCTSTCHISRCGDGHTNRAAGETCDDGATNGDACDYNHPDCLRCDSTCTTTINPGGPFCGDGILQAQFHEQCEPSRGPNQDSPTCNSDCTPLACGDGHINMAGGEQCDNFNDDMHRCGTCPAGCFAGPTSAAQATITIKPSDGSQINKGDTDDNFTLTDGFGGMLTFEFTTGSTTISGAVPIQFAPASDGAATIATKMAAAIHTQQGFGIDASVPDPQSTPPTVILTNRHKSSFGNTTIMFSGLIDFVFGSGTAQFTGGAAGNCAKDAGCVTGDDCASGICSASHQCQ